MMLIFLAWFAADHSASARARIGEADIAARVGEFVPDSYKNFDIGDDTWRLRVWHIADEGGYAWPAIACEGGVAAVSVGIPVGVKASVAPLDLARSLLDGDDIHAGLTPPFGLIARDGSTAGAERLVIQQDWLGMCRVFAGSAQGVTAYSNRPTLLGRFLHRRLRPSRSGWTSYAITGHFADDTSPVDGVSLLAPGERVTARRQGNGWTVTSERRHALDDVVRSGLEMRGGGPEAALGQAAAGFCDALASVGRLNREPVSLGLSGGKDSRLIAAAMVAAGQAPVLHTNSDNGAEAETASELVRLLAAKRGLVLPHDVRPVGAARDVFTVGLHGRTIRLQRYHDFQYPATYLVRRPAAERLEAKLPRVVLSGAAGEIATGYWYPSVANESEAAVVRAVRRHAMGAVEPDAAAEQAAKRERARLNSTLAHATSIGLAGCERADYVYLRERMRRWATNPYHFALVAPFLAPSVVAASFALTAAEKRKRAMHEGLLQRFVPEWLSVPYVSGGAGPSSASRVWDDDGLQTMRELHNGPWSDLMDLLNPIAVGAALDACAAGTPDIRSQGTLQTFTALAVAARTFEPESLRWLSQTRRRVRRVVPAQHISAKVIGKAKSMMR